MLSNFKNDVLCTFSCISLYFLPFVAALLWAAIVYFFYILVVRAVIACCISRTVCYAVY
jgi:hypothetical protein